MMLTRYGGFGYAYVCAISCRGCAGSASPRSDRDDDVQSAARLHAAASKAHWRTDGQEESCWSARAGSARRPTTKASTSSAASPSISAPSRWSRRWRTARSSSIHAGARGGDRLSLRHGGLQAIRRGHPLRYRRELDPAAAGRLAARASTMPNRLKLIRDWTARGGGLLHDRRIPQLPGHRRHGALARTPVEEALPVTCLPYDDRIEAPEGIELEMTSRTIRSSRASRHPGRCSSA